MTGDAARRFARIAFACGFTRRAVALGLRNFERRVDAKCHARPTRGIVA
jgi:hypothetical protein